jgi:hypothetical protein
MRALGAVVLGDSVDAVALFELVLLHSRHIVVGAPSGYALDGVGILTTSWVSGGYFHW